MAVGGQALHWGGTCNRFSEEDLRLKSMYGLYEDWPLEWSELEKFYCEAERRLGVSGEPSPFPGDQRSEPYPMQPIPLTWSLDRLREWGNKSGIPFQATPQAKNTVAYDGRSRLHPLRHLRHLPHRRPLLARFHVQAAASPKRKSRCTITR